MNAPTPAGSFAHAQTPVSLTLPLGQLVAKDQVRKHFDDADLQDLAASIRADGLLSPIVVRRARGPSGGESLDRYEIVAGERRVRAAQLAGLTEIRAELHENLSDTTVQVLQLVENVQRVDLSLFEQCEGVAALVKQLEGVDGKTGAQNAAAKLGKSLAWISRRAGVVDAPIEIKQLVKAGELTDVELATGLAELKQVAPKKQYEQLVDHVKNGEAWYGEPITRDLVREVVKTAKEDLKRKEQETKDRKAGKKKPVDPYQAQMAKERTEKAARQERWGAIGPVVAKFATAAAKAIGIEVEPPRYDGYHVDPVPSSMEACNFQWTFEGSAEAAKKVVSKTGLTLKLECRLPALTPDQALKLEQALGTKLRWTKEWSRNPLTGKQLATMAAKAGAKVELPQLPKPAPATAPEAKPASKAAKKKAK